MSCPLLPPEPMTTCPRNRTLTPYERISNNKGCIIYFLELYSNMLCKLLTVTLQRAVPWLRQLVNSLLLQKPGSLPREFLVGFMVDTVTLGHIFLRVLRFSPIFLIPPMFHTHNSFIYNHCCVIVAIDSIIK